MELNRRGFLAGMLAAAAAPAIVRAESMMRLYVPPQSIVPVLWGDGIHDDAPGLEALLNRREVRMNPLGRWADAQPGLICGGVFWVGRTIVLDQDPTVIIKNCHFKSMGLQANAPLLLQRARKAAAPPCVIAPPY
jgi:hypothetical protein